MLSKKEKIQLQMMMTIAHKEFEQDLLRHAHFRVSDRGRCDDLVQDTFLKTWVYLIKAGKITSMKPFLYHVLNCLIIDEYRKKKSVSLDALLETGFEPGDDHYERAVNMLDGRAAVDMISTLPIAYQKIMTLRHINDLSLSEIADETGLTKNLVAVKTHRGMDKLRALYAQSLIPNMA